MATRTDTFDLGALRLTSGEGRRLGLAVALEDFELAGHRYSVGAAAPSTATEAEGDGSTVIPVGDQIPVTLDISRMTGQGYALHVAFTAALHGPCMRCLEPADPVFSVDAREVSQPGEGDELESPYVLESILDLGAWTRDALALALPSALLCRPECRGLCPVCGADLNVAGPDHHHEAAPDPRWAALAELSFEAPGGRPAPEPEPDAESEPDAEPDAEPEPDPDPDTPAPAAEADPTPESEAKTPEV
ncbi:MAG TPA: DUF177 domain-containing protein [Solirubrobacteraceae bacterium]|nr:DUF177 domain-containing protein [Solirubrobacteraceae bacterium]